ncbi:MAG: exonuclease [Bacteroidetes bacterium]|nr:exonuclease [Bacteroidota bacterium]
MKSFTAIDFETSSHKPYSICQVGLVRVENGVITEEIDLLVKPPDNHFHYMFPEIHGITPYKTKDAPAFDKIWHLIKPHIHKQNVVAHNIAFDKNCLKQVLEYYKLTLPEYQEHCTYRIYGESLDKCCKKHKINLNHHNALSDAKACAELFLLHLKN